MAKELKKVNVVTVGVGYTAGIVAAECTRAGLSVVGLERGHFRTVDDFQHLHDEWRYGLNYALMQDLSRETVSFRNNANMKALPMRKLGSFLLGNGLGGAGVHWNGMNFRFFPYDFEIRSKTEERYGKNKIDKDYLIRDWGLTYDELEPYYSKFEQVIGCSGASVSPFDGKRSILYPNPPLVTTKCMKMFDDGAKKLGLHPYVLPAGISSRTYKNPYGMTLYPCMYCAYCERFACEYDSKASPNNTMFPAAEATGKFDLRCNANVLEVMKKGEKVTGVRYINTLTMEEFIQPADIVVLTSYVMNNAKLLILAKIGEQYDPKTGRGTLGKNYCYQINSGATGFFKDKMNLFAGAGALGIGVDDYNGDNFDHSGLDFIHGGLISLLQAGRRPIDNNPVPPGTPGWGPEFKKASLYHFNRSLSVSSQGASMPHRDNYLSLDDTYKDAYGLPLLRMTYDFTPQDRALHAYIRGKCEEIVRSMGADTVASGPIAANYNIVPYQTTHNTGGTIMGKEPHDSVVNTYLQHWNAENLFVVGAGNFSHNGGCNPTGTVGALGYRCAEGIIKYSQKGGSLA